MEDGPSAMGTMDNDCLSDLGHTTNFTTQVNSATTSIGRAALCLNQSSTLPSSPIPVLPRIQDKISQGEYINFTTIQPEAMFETPEPHSQSLILQLNLEGDNYLIQPQPPIVRSIHLGHGMEAWSFYQ